MNSQDIKQLLDSCFIAKRITETMEALPDGYKPRHIHVINCIFTLSQSRGAVRVSDVSEMLNITTPSVTKLIHELEERKVLRKYSLEDDKRVTLLELTALGEEYQSRYVTSYHARWAENMADVTKEEVDTVTAVIAKLKKAMPQGGSYEK